MKVLVLFYSLYGHIYKMAQAVAEGAGELDNTQVDLMRVPETLPDNVIEMMGATDSVKSMENVPVATPEDLASADAIIFGTPTRFGNMCGQMRQFLDSTGQLWAAGALVGKVGSVFTSSGTQHGGQESTILSFFNTLYHHGMVVVGLPYSFQGQVGVEAVDGGTPYGASTIAGSTGERMPSENELSAGRFQGKHVAGIAMKLTS